MEKIVVPMIKFGEFIKNKHKFNKTMEEFKDFVINISGNNIRSSNISTFVSVLLIQKYNDAESMINDLFEDMSEEQIQTAIDFSTWAIKLKD